MDYGYAQASQIVVEERQRKEFDEAAIEELAKSIAEDGLIHLPHLREDRILVVGERRLRAMKKLHETKVPFSYLGKKVPHNFIPYVKNEGLTPLKAFSLELAENLYRKDLTWQERANAVKKLHELRTMENAAHTVNDTAAELNGHLPTTVTPSQTSEQIRLAENLHIPEVAKAKSVREAMNELKKHEKRLQFQTLAVQTTRTSDGLVLENCKALDGMLKLPDASIDVILTDPPYFIGADKFNHSTSQDHMYSDDPKEFDAFFSDKLFEQINRVTKAEAHLYLFCDARWWMKLNLLFTFHGWKVWNFPLIWVKNVGSVADAKHGPQHLYEMILYAIKGDKMVNPGLYPDVINIPAVADKVHAAQKPAELFLELARRSVVPGNTLLDFCCGSGPIFRAAWDLKCKAYGFDVDPAAIGQSQTVIKHIAQYPAMKVANGSWVAPENLENIL